MRFRAWFLILGLVSAGAIIGCGTSVGKIEPLVPVAGTLLVDGEPLDGVLVTFIPEQDVKDRLGGSGTTDEGGAFLITHHAQNQPGLPVGKYSVAYSRMRLADGSAPPELQKGEQQDPANIKIETFPTHLTTPDPREVANQVDIPAEGSTDLELKISVKPVAK